MSATAKAIIVYMLSHSDGWIATMESLGTVFSESKARISRAVRELESMGYAKRKLITKNGRAAGVLWKWSDTPR